MNEHIEERIERYAELSPDDRRAVDTFIASHPELAPLLDEVKTWDRLLAEGRLAAADPPGDEMLAYYQVTRRLQSQDPPEPLKTLFRRIEAAVAASPELQARVDAVRERVAELEAAVDPAAQFERLTGRSYDDEAEAPSAIEVVHPTPEKVHPTPEKVHPTPEKVHATPEKVHATPEKVHATPEKVHPTPDPEKVHPAPEVVHPAPEKVHPTPETAPPAREFVSTSPPPTRGSGSTLRKVLQSLSAIAALYAALFFGGRMLQPEHERLARMGSDELTLPGYDALRAAGDRVPEADAPADQLYLSALEVLRESQRSTLGLFPRFDEPLLANGIALLQRVVELEPDGSFLALEASYLLGKARLGLGDVEAARRSLEEVVEGRGRKAGDADALLRRLPES